jgi:transposase InsO family protein
MKLLLDMTIMWICQNESLVKVDYLTLVIMDFFRGRQISWFFSKLVESFLAVLNFHDLEF